MEKSFELGPLTGHTALVEAEATEVTGSVTSVDGGALIVTCDQECWPPGQIHVVSISVFAPDALYRVSGKATAHGFDVICDADIELQRIQRRRWPRKRLDLPVTLCPVENGARMTGLPGRTIDLSVGGLYLETIGRLESAGDPMVILDLPDGTTVVASAATISSEDLGDGWRYRLAFQDLDEEDAARLAQLTTA